MDFNTNNNENLENIIDVSWIPGVLNTVYQHNVSTVFAGTTSIKNTPVFISSDAAYPATAGPSSFMRENPVQVRNDGIFDRTVQPANTKHNIDHAPIFTPQKIIDYAHQHRKTFDDYMRDFHVFRFIEHNHKTTKHITVFIQDVNIEKVIEKRSEVALRQKTLGYLRQTEKPEDSVSNPSYPVYGATDELKKNHGWVSLVAKRDCRKAVKS